MKEALCIYTCLTKYADEVYEKGLCRESNAFFVADIRPPYVTDLRLKNTLMVSIFHGISIDVWKNLARYYGKLYDCMKAVAGDEEITMFLFKSPFNKGIEEDSYFYKLEGALDYQVTYPYYKIKTTGVVTVDAVKTEKIQIRGTLVTDNCSKEYPNFFYREGGKQQYIPGIKGAEIKNYCNGIAEKKLFNLYRERDTKWEKILH